jgi:1,4-dihydroxy-2-naphthoyl-CoA synthase
MQVGSRGSTNPHRPTDAAADDPRMAEANDEECALSHQTLLSVTDGPVATITLNRRERLNTIVPPMPEEFETAVGQATRDSEVQVIVVRGARPSR